jgi:hypothetical protein
MDKAAASKLCIVGSIPTINYKIGPVHRHVAGPKLFTLPGKTCYNPSMSEEPVLQNPTVSLSQLLREGMERSTHYKVARDLAKVLDPPKSSEHVRRCLTGEDTPTDNDLRTMCDRLKIKYSVAKPLALKARLEQVKRREALKDPEFLEIMDTWVNDPSVALCVKTWREDPEFAMLAKIYRLLTRQERERVFKTAIALKLPKTHSAVA